MLFLYKLARAQILHTDHDMHYRTCTCNTYDSKVLHEVCHDGPHCCILSCCPVLTIIGLLSAMDRTRAQGYWPAMDRIPATCPIRRQSETIIVLCTRGCYVAG